MIYSVIKCEKETVALEFGRAFLKAHIDNFSYTAKENDLVFWQNGKFVKSRQATEQTKENYFLRTQNVAVKKK